MSSAIYSSPCSRKNSGDVSFFSRHDHKLVTKMSASNSTHFEWCADSRHFLTATTAPRLNIDNGYACTLTLIQCFRPVTSSLGSKSGTTPRALLSSSLLISYGPPRSRPFRHLLTQLETFLPFQRQLALSLLLRRRSLSTGPLAQEGVRLLPKSKKRCS